MANVLKNLARSLVATAATQYVTAANPGTPNNQRVTIKRLKVVNINAGGGAAATISVWAGTLADDAPAIVKSITLTGGEALEWDPTTIILEPGESLYAQASVASTLSLGADGLRQTE